MNTDKKNIQEGTENTENLQQETQPESAPTLDVAAEETTGEASPEAEA